MRLFPLKQEGKSVIGLSSKSIVTELPTGSSDREHKEDGTERKLELRIAIVLTRVLRMSKKVPAPFRDLHPLQVMVVSDEAPESDCGSEVSAELLNSTLVKFFILPNISGMDENDPDAVSLMSPVLSEKSGNCGNPVAGELTRTTSVKFVKPLTKVAEQSFTADVVSHE